MKADVPRHRSPSFGGPALGEFAFSCCCAIAVPAQPRFVDTEAFEDGARKSLCHRSKRVRATAGENHGAFGFASRVLVSGSVRRAPTPAFHAPRDRLRSRPEHIMPSCPPRASSLTESAAPGRASVPSGDSPQITRAASPYHELRPIDQTRHHHMLRRTGAIMNSSATAGTDVCKDKHGSSDMSGTASYDALQQPKAPLSSHLHSTPKPALGLLRTKLKPVFTRSGD